MEMIRRPITVAEYNRMAEVGILDPDERVELLDGDIVVVPPQGPEHASIITRTHEELVRRLERRAIVTSQIPVILSDRSEPEPDIAVLARRDDYYKSALPSAADIRALVEVADSSLRIDRGAKLRIYSEAGIEEYWVIDVKRNVIEVYREPRDGRYESLTTLCPGDDASFLAFPDDVFTVDELIG